MYKPGNVSRPPPLVAPHQPRLDWQMWFAALGPHTHSPWFTSLVLCLLRGSEPGEAGRGGGGASGKDRSGAGVRWREAGQRGWRGRGFREGRGFRGVGQQAR